MSRRDRIVLQLLLWALDAAIAALDWCQDRTNDLADRLR